MADAPGAADDADGASPSPFRRFPWVQFAFCIACLGLAAWTWMRNSYAWEMSPSEFWQSARQDVDWDRDPVVGPYIRVAGKVHYVFSNNMSPFGYDTGTTFQAYDGSKAVAVHLPADIDVSASPGGDVWAGRVIRWDFLDSDDKCYRVDYVLDASFGRFTGESVAGLVVGAMGCLVFGLYLRRWLRERKAAA